MRSQLPFEKMMPKIVEVWSDAAKKWSETNFQCILYFLDFP